MTRLDLSLIARFLNHDRNNSKKEFSSVSRVDSGSLNDCVKKSDFPFFFRFPSVFLL